MEMANIKFNQNGVSFNVRMQNNDALGTHIGVFADGVEIGCVFVDHDHIMIHNKNVRKKSDRMHRCQSHQFVSVLSNNVLRLSKELTARQEAILLSMVLFLTPRVYVL